VTSATLRSRREVGVEAIEDIGWQVGEQLAQAGGDRQGVLGR